MKTYNAKNKISKNLKDRIEKAIETHEKYTKSYFWSNCGNANYRRNKESEFLNENPDFKVWTNGGLMVVVQTLRISCNNYYYKLIVEVDGIKKDIRELKKIIR